MVHPDLLDRRQLRSVGCVALQVDVVHVRRVGGGHNLFVIHLEQVRSVYKVPMGWANDLRSKNESCMSTWQCGNRKRDRVANAEMRAPARRHGGPFAQFFWAPK